MGQLHTDGLEGELSDQLLERCTHLLEVQKDEMTDVVVHMERGRYPALSESRAPFTNLQCEVRGAETVGTLRQVYERVLPGLTGLESLEPSQAMSELTTLVQLLEEGVPPRLAPSSLIAEMDVRG